MSSPKEAADLIYNEALTSVMAHALRGTQNHFLKAGVELDIRLVVDKGGEVVNAGQSLSPSLVVTNPTGRAATNKITRIKAKIFIHGDANIHLARFCVAHELYHILLELKDFIRGDRTQWIKVPVNKTVEDECDEFAFNLCSKHHDFHCDEDVRNNKLKFPAAAVKKPFPIKEKKHWPPGVGMDPAHPFHKL